VNGVCRKTLTATLFLLLTAASADAQTGRADLRYVAPLPATVTFTTVDTVTSTVSGTPAGDMSTSGVIHSVSELRFAPAAEGFIVTATLKALSGVMTTAMGDMPVQSGEGEPVEFRLGVTGADMEELSRSLGAQPTEATSPGDVLGSGRAMAGLMNLPGREVRLGETWIDTLRLAPVVEGSQATVEIVSRGTYAADTTVDGRTLNVLRVTSETTSNMSGAVQGMNLTQKATSTTEETILWDSARRMPIMREATGRMLTESFMSDYGITMTMNANTRSHTTALIHD
jgi:hypothetical protein